MIKIGEKKIYNRRNKSNFLKIHTAREKRGNAGKPSHIKLKSSLKCKS